ncbi:MAG: hypothetical protein ACJ73N_11770 [Bryobacteraceae bacterium]
MIPKDLLADIDELIGQQDRNSFLVEVLQKEVNRRRLPIPKQSRTAFKG